MRGGMVVASRVMVAPGRLRVVMRLMQLTGMMTLAGEEAG